MRYNFQMLNWLEKIVEKIAKNEVKSDDLQDINIGDVDSGRYIYYAFISYSHKDIRWAKKLQRRLEAYNLPTKIREQIERERTLPQKIYPIFRDETDLLSGELKEELKRNLIASRNLIVLLSPNSAKKVTGKKEEVEFNWVDFEVNYFLTQTDKSDLSNEDASLADVKHRKTKHLLPVLISGSLETALSKQLQNEILKDTIINAQTEEWVTVFSRIVGSILGIAPAVIENREKRRECLRRRIRRGIGCLIMGIISLLLAYLWDVMPEKIKYYSDYTERWGIPCGIGELSHEQILPRCSHYRFVYRGRVGLFGNRILRKVVKCNSSGTVLCPANVDLFSSEINNRFSYLKLRYKEGNRLYAIDCCNEYDELIVRKFYSGDKNYCVDFKWVAEKGREDPATMRADTSFFETSIDTRSRIQRKLLSFSPEGFIVREKYKDSNNYTIQDMNGISGIEYKRDGLGRVVKASFLGVDDCVKANRKGIAHKCYEYEGTQIKEVSCYDSGMNLCFNEDRWEKVLHTYDKNENPICTQFFDENGLPCLNKYWVAGWNRKFDLHGNLIEAQGFDALGSIAMCKEGFAKVTRAYDEKGRIVEESYWGPHGQRVLHATEKSYTGYKIAYKDESNTVLFSFLDLNGNMIGRSVYPSKMLVARDKKENLVKIEYLDGNGRLKAKENGCAAVIIKYNGQGQEIERTTLNNQGNLHAINGVARVTKEYDSWGNEIRKTFFDSDNSLALCVAYQEKKYDSRGNVVEILYLDHQGRLRENPDLLWAARLTNAYDNHGNIISAFFFDAQNQPLYLQGAGYAGYRATYDAAGNHTCQKYINETGSLVAREDVGFAEWRSKFDTRGNEIERSFYDVAGNLTATKEGWAKIKYEYDERDFCIKKTFFGVDGCLALNTNGVASVHSKYNRRGLIVEEAMFDLLNMPCNNTEGVSKTKVEYNEYGNIILTAYYDKDGLPTTNSQGILKEVSSYGLEGSFWLETISYSREGVGVNLDPEIARLVERVATSFVGVERFYIGWDNQIIKYEKDDFKQNLFEAVQQVTTDLAEIRSRLVESLKEESVASLLEVLESIGDNSAMLAFRNDVLKLIEEKKSEEKRNK